jgi:two-component system LytT family sensor kinase
MLLQVISSVVLLTPILFTVNILSDIFFSHLEFMTPQFKAIMYVVFVLVIALINFSFYGAHFFNQWRSAIEEKARLHIQAADAEKEKTMMQYQHLRNQVNPHFLFNTLTSLDGLILSDPPLASKFVKHLAKVYRYVLEQPEGEVVSLEHEFGFIGHYISMLKVKYKDALHIAVDLPATALDKGIAMVTSQMLIDNAIKHNIVHVSTPLNIDIKVDGPFLVFTNNKQIRKQIEVSTKQGLKHLQQLYAYLTPVPVEIHDTQAFFQVKLPLL